MRLATTWAVVFLYLAIALSARCQTAGFNPNHPKALSVSSGSWHIVSLGRQQCLANCASGYELVFGVDNGTVQGRFQLTISSGMEQADQLVVGANNMLIVLGHANGDVEQVATYDLLRRTAGAAFYCYSPSVSNDGRYIAFVNFYPAHGSPLYLTSDVYGVVEVRLLTQIKLESPFSSVGIPIFPEENRRKRTFNSLMPPGAQDVHRSVSAFQ